MRVVAIFLMICVLSATNASAQMVCAEPSKQFTTALQGDINATAEGITRFF